MYNGVTCYLLNGWAMEVRNFIKKKTVKLRYNFTLMLA
jgi:hypothetical protein